MNQVASGKRWAQLGSASMWLATFLCFAFATVPLARAQTFSASIAGIVTDPTGAVESGAKVTLVNSSTNDTRAYMTTNDGTYKFDNLLPGTYQITVEASGFKTYTQQNMLLRANTSASVDVVLQVGDTQQKVEVTGEAVLLDTQSANNTVTLDSTLLQSLPNNTRNPLNFLFSLAGTTEGQGGMTSRSQTFDQLFSQFGINGGRTGDAQILIDGAPSTAMDWGGLMVSPINDTVQEQQVMTNVYDAQYERSGMGVVTLITKGGSNQFHGEVYDYFRNSALDANLWSNNKYDLPKNQLKRNQFGGNLSGPILKRYGLYFFGAYEGIRQPDTENSGLQTVPTALERTGDFSQTLNTNGDPVTIYNPFSTTATTDADGNTIYTRTPFPGNKIPAQYLTSQGQAIANLYPLPNRPSDQVYNNNNYYSQGTGNTSNDKFDARIDWAQHPTNRLFGRISDRVRQKQTPACFYCNGADTGNGNNDVGVQVVLNDTFTPSPTWVVNGYVGYSRWREIHTPVGKGVASAATIGLPTSFFQSNALPTIGVDNYSGLGNGFDATYTRYSETAQGNFTKQFSKHTLRFGANYDVFMINNNPQGVGNLSFSNSTNACDPSDSGICNFQPGQTSLITGNGLAAVLMGTGDISQSTNIDPAMAQHAWGGYVQDAWRITPNFTLNVGLRYENQLPATERYNRLTWFDPNVVNPISSQLGYTVKGGFEYANSNHRYAWDPDNTNFAPRIGIAYHPTEKLVIRAGAGIFYTPTSAMISFDDGQFIGFGSSTTSFGTEGGQGIFPIQSVLNPFPNGLVPQTGSSEGLLTRVGLGQGQIWPKGFHPVGHTQQWNFDVQYQLDSHSVFEFGYTGVTGKNLMYGNPNINANQLPTSYLSLGDSLNEYVTNPFYGIITDPNSSLANPTIQRFQLLQPFPQFGNLNWTRSLPGAVSSYNALDVKYNHAFSHGLSAIVTYRWSKALDDGSEDLVGWSIGNMWRDSYNTRLDYGVSTHDMPHSFAVAAVYDLPYGTGKQWGGNAPWIVKQTLGNWQLSTNIRVSSGFPIFGISDGNYTPLTYWYGFPGSGTGEIPDIVGNPVPSNRTPDHWINADAFASTFGQYRYGNTPNRLPYLREDVTKNVDLSVAKSFGPERFKVQFRGEFLNAFNHPIFGGNYNINTVLQGQGNFGEWYNTRNDPRNIQLSLRASF